MLTISIYYQTKVTNLRGSESFMGHWCGGMNSFFAWKRVVEIGYRVSTNALEDGGRYICVTLFDGSAEFLFLVVLKDTPQFGAQKKKTEI